jgi:hypothetical protein
MKFVLVGVAVAVAHYLRRQVFHYVDLSAVLEQARTIKDGLIFLRVAIFYTAAILAITQGLYVSCQNHFFALGLR